ncbi:MAG: Ferric transporter ATP-binding subunit [Dehalococcoidia bacterium]|nr:Ferric transporter ATP-binding subunit [Dehalococcoidia bacterium]
MRIIRAWLILVIFLGLLAACTPQAGQQQSPPASVTAAPISPGTTAGTPTSNLSPLTSQDAAWAKIVEAAKKEGKVNAYSFTWVGDIGLAVAKAFKEKYGITLGIMTGRGAEFAERIKTERRLGQQVADMTEGSVGLIDNMRLDKVLTSVYDDLPSLREKGVWLVEPTVVDPQDKANLTWRVLAYTPYINPKLVKPSETPQYWKDLLTPAWKGKMGMNDPRLTTSSYQMIVVLMDSKVWDEDYIRALYRQNPRFYVTGAEAFPALARGEINLVVDGADANAGRFALEGAPIQAIDIKDGTLLTTASIAAITGGPNPNATRVLLNWLFSPEGQSIAGKAQGNKMVRKDIPDFRPEALQAQITKPLVITVKQLDKSTEMFREKWFDKLVGR